MTFTVYVVVPAVPVGLSDDVVMSTLAVGLILSVTGNGDSVFVDILCFAVEKLCVITGDED